MSERHVVWNDDKVTVWSNGAACTSYGAWLGMDELPASYALKKMAAEITALKQQVMSRVARETLRANEDAEIADRYISTNVRISGFLERVERLEKRVDAVERFHCVCACLAIGALLLLAVWVVS